MNIDSTLREELELVAGGAQPSPPDIARLIRTGAAHRTRVRRTRAVATLAAAAVAVTGAVLAPRMLGGGDDKHIEPTQAPTFEDLPVGSPTELPWAKDGILHVDGESTDITEEARFFYAAGTTVVMRGETDTWLVAGHRLVALEGTSFGRTPVISADGDQVALSSPTQGMTKISVYDVDGAGLVATKEVEGGANAVRVEAILSDGRVVFVGDQQRREFIWSPESGETTARPKGAGFLVAAQWPGGVSFQDEYGTLDARGRYHRVGTLQSTSLIGIFGDRWDRRGRRFLDEGNKPDDGNLKQFYSVEDVESGRRVELVLPKAGGFQTVGWESDDRVVLAATSPSGSTTLGLMRCDVETGGCERVGGVPAGISIPSSGP